MKTLCFSCFEHKVLKPLAGAIIFYIEEKFVERIPAEDGYACAHCGDAPATFLIEGFVKQ